MPLLFITAGPYAGQNLELDARTAKVALKDKWAVDTTAEGYDAFDSHAAIGAPPYAASLQAFLDEVNGPPVVKPVAEGGPGKPEPEPVDAPTDPVDATDHGAKAPVADETESKPVGGSGRKGK